MNTIIDLNMSISKNECSGLNITGGNDVSGVFFGTPIECNEGDGEMIFIIKFREKVCLNQILFESGMDKSKYPDYVKIYANTSDLDFGDAENIPPTEMIKLIGNFGKKIKINVPKYRNISELCVSNTL